VISVQTRPASERRQRRRWRAALVWAAVVPLSVFATVRVAGVTHGSLVVAALAFTPYAAIVAVLPFVVALVSRAWLAAVVAGVALGVLGACVLPRAVGGPEAVDGRIALRVLTANMEYGQADPSSLLTIVREQQVDLLALQEYTAGARQALDAAGIAALLPYRVAYPVDGVGGSALYSRFPLTDGAYRPLPPFFGQASATVSVPGAREVLVESVHPAAPDGADLVPHWRTGLAAEPRATPDGPLRLLLGDFNATLDHAPVQRLLDSGYRDAAAVVGRGLQPSWPYDGSPLPKVTIDHVLADRRIGVRATDVYANPGSDHRAVFASLVLPSG
jgi:endonuclease/exonuclease/phosphatase (EEP) superfamily protein YafD